MSKPKFYSMYASCTDSKGEKHIVTVVGRLDQTRESQLVQEPTQVETKPNCFTDGVLCFSIKKLHRVLTLGLSICHPNDTFDEEVGINVAKQRIKKGAHLGRLETSDVTMLTEDAIMGEIMVKLNHICNTIDDFLP